METTSETVPANGKGTYDEEFGLQFQAHTLAVTCRHPTFALRFRSVLDPAYFTSPAHRVVSKAMLAHVDKYRAVPTKPTLVQAIKASAGDKLFEPAVAVVNKLYAADISDAEAVSDQVIRFGRLQAMCNAVLEASDMLAKGDRDIVPVIKRAEIVGQDMQDLGIDYVNADRKGWYDDEDLSDRVQTGIEHLDMAFGGGPRRGCLYVILAPTKRGKSTVLTNFGYGGIVSAHAYDVAHYSHEMHRKSVAMRYDLRISGSDFPLRRTDPEAYAVAVAARAKKYCHGRLYIQSYTTRTCTVAMLRSHLTMLKANGFNPSQIIVDYADIMKPERRMGELRHEQAGIYEDLRSLAGEFDAVVWTASQASKAALEMDTPTMAMFAESFEKGQIVDGAVALAQNVDEAQTGRCRLVLIGMRDEPDGTTVECEIQRPRMRILSTALIDPQGNVLSGQSYNNPGMTAPPPAKKANGGGFAGGVKGKAPTKKVTPHNPDAEDKLKMMQAQAAPKKPSMKPTQE